MSGIQPASISDMRKKNTNAVLRSRILAALLAGIVLSSCYPTVVWAAEPTGGQWITLGDDNCYVGTATSGSNVTLDDNRKNDDFYGGYVNGTVTDNVVADNTVTVTGNGSAYNVNGGLAYNAGTCEVKRNHVIIQSGATVVHGTEGGATSGSGNVEDNTVTADGANLKTVTGGMASGGGNAVRNIVTLNDTNATDNVIGGKTTKNGKANYNEIIISGSSELGYFVFGGSCSGDGEASYNKVTMSGGYVDYGIYGGYSSKSAAVSGNKVLISSAGHAGYHVYGGYSDSGNVKDNKVSVNGGQIDYNVYGGSSKSGDVTDNMVSISNGEVKKDIYGGYSESGDATGNKVFINGGVVKGDVLGGATDGIGEAIGNIVEITNASGVNPTISGTIYGGYGKNASDVRTGNTLNIYTKGLISKNVRNFENYNFYLPADTVNGETILTLTNAGGTDISGSNVNVGLEGSASTLQSGDKVSLLTNTNGITANGVTYGKLQQGVSIEYEFITGLSADGQSIVATVAGGSDYPTAKTTEQAKSPVETQLAAAAFLNSGADTVAGSCIANAVQMAGGTTAEMFGAMSGGSMRYKSGSYADVHGYNMALGLAKAVTNNAGKLTYGSLLEYGWGNYTSHLDSGIRADGNTKYYGIGLLARQDNNDGVYYEGSLRYGRMDADYASGDLIGAGGSKVFADYDSSSSYYGAHLGIGKVNKINDTTKADLYAKLFYTHQGGDSVTLGGEGNGEVYDFDAVDSTRARVGARLSKDYGERSSGYVGLAYEYEFDGEARATVKGLSTPLPSIKGSSGLLEIGYILQPKGVNDPMINIGLQGWGGKKQGVSGSVNFVWKF